MKTKGFFQKHFMRPWYQNKTTTKNYRLIFVVNRDTVILKKILANLVQQYSMTKWNLFQGFKDGFKILKPVNMIYYFNKMKNKNTSIWSYLSMQKKAYNKIQCQQKIYVKLLKRKYNST